MLVDSNDKKNFDEESIKSLLDYIEIEYLAKKVDFDESIMELSKEIKSSIWKKQKARLGWS